MRLFKSEKPITRGERKNEEREKRAVEMGVAAKFKLENDVRFIFLFAFLLTPFFLRQTKDARKIGNSSNKFVRYFFALEISFIKRRRIKQKSHSFSRKIRIKLNEFQVQMKHLPFTTAGDVIRK